MRFPSMRPARSRIFRCSAAVGWLTPSLLAMYSEHTPSRTRSPSTCGGKCASGSFSHSRICCLRSLASALSASCGSTWSVWQLAKSLASEPIAFLAELPGLVQPVYSDRDPEQHHRPARQPQQRCGHGLVSDAAPEDVPAELGVVVRGEGVADPLDEVGHELERKEDAGQEGHRKVDDVDDGRRGVGADAVADR